MAGFAIQACIGRWEIPQLTLFMARDLGCCARMLAGICSVRAATLTVRPQSYLPTYWYNGSLKYQR